MKIARLLLLTAVCAVSLRAAELTWWTDLAAARQLAAREHKQLLVDFTGSAWCPPCIALHREVLTTAAFAEYAKNYVLVKLDYPRRADRTPAKIAADPALKKLMELKERYGIEGYPTLLFLSPADEDKGRLVGYDEGQGPEKYLAQLDRKRN
ncbi:MAG: thioredoxin family protein [Opitutae bacterium]|nr:thioredoxin family protein [Opitutae bacterium]